MSVYLGGESPIGSYDPTTRKVVGAGDKRVVFMDLKTVSLEDLEKEIKRRKEPKPERVAIPDFNELENLCSAYIDILHDGRTPNEDHSHFIFEVAMEAFYGDNIWKWVNPKLK